MNYDGDTPTLGEVIRIGAQHAVEDINVAYPYEVIEQDLNTGLVVVAPLIKVRDDQDNVAELPVLEEVVVQYPSGGGYHFVYPLAEGDEGIVILSSRSISQWVESGDKEADPEGRRISSLADAFFIPGIRSRVNARPELVSQVLSLGCDDGVQEVVVKGAPVRVGSETASDALAKSVPVTSDLTKIAADMVTIAAEFLALGRAFSPSFTSPTNNATTKILGE
jgi:hypothetical protein